MSHNTSNIVTDITHLISTDSNSTGNRQVANCAVNTFKQGGACCDRVAITVKSTGKVLVIGSRHRNVSSQIVFSGSIHSGEFLCCSYSSALRLVVCRDRTDSGFLVRSGGADRSEHCHAHDHGQSKQNK